MSGTVRVPIKRERDKDVALIPDSTLRPWVPVHTDEDTKIEQEILQLEEGMTDCRLNSRWGISDIDKIPLEMLELRNAIKDPDWYKDKTEVEEEEKSDEEVIDGRPETDINQSSEESKALQEGSEETTLPSDSFPVPAPQLSKPPALFKVRRKKPKKMIRSAAFMSNPRIKSFFDTRSGGKDTSRPSTSDSIFSTARSSSMPLLIDKESTSSTLSNEVVNLLTLPSPSSHTMPSSTPYRNIDLVVDYMDTDNTIHHSTSQPTVSSLPITPSPRNSLMEINNTTQKTNMTPNLLLPNANTKNSNPNACTGQTNDISESHINQNITNNSKTLPSLKGSIPSNSNIPNISTASPKNKGMLSSTSSLSAAAQTKMMTIANGNITPTVVNSSANNVNKSSQPLGSARNRLVEDRFESRPQSAALGKIMISNKRGTTGPVSSIRLENMKQSYHKQMNKKSNISSADHHLVDTLLDKHVVEQNVNWAKETQSRNKTDHTWSLLQTKGFFEAVGPSNIYQSEMSFGHTVDEKALRTINSERDITHCVRRNDVHDWHESAIKQHILMFPQGESLKF
mmetsp:Transcript_16788/g.16881  ORF Transcript_16788/g.16881 Transcript_16788/m.16881 type:complete len:567 (+) Transcript_16788:292-1992(+)|eukprot:CAMPEP_0182431354 /NCGR_PEP_ID=MMETSP1167-20130531/48540_1 /TAXON_ID=2988 /ORGANISM="Mallomonas Sp, Strain CCMP3275" /LENGTH=566 /DNA_ID=CAMNT_0024617605 /DNA_START=213 /DNA_END=1913 /DNA_ORIENTATION=-